MTFVEQLRRSISSGTGAPSTRGPGLVLNEEVVTALPGCDLDEPETSQQRYQLWKLRQEKPLPVEYLLPRIERVIEPEWPSFMRRAATTMTTEELRQKLADLGPWYVPFLLGDDVNTMEFTDNWGAAVLSKGNAERMQFRTELICGTLAALLGDALGQMTVLDIGCNSGWFSFDIADRGARSVDGFDLRARNIEQAEFLASYLGIDDVHFEVADAGAFVSGRQWDVVLNLGVLYHVTNPLQFMQQTYDLCGKYAIVDTICHTEAFSGYMLFGNKDTTHPHEGGEAWEFHPTYRGAIDTIRSAGFSEVVEIVSPTSTASGLYRDGARRCFLAVK